MNLWICLTIASGLMMAGAATAAPQPTEVLLPKTTVGFASVQNYDTFREQWKKTQLGKLAEDPVMKPFVDDMRNQMKKQWSDIRDRLGLNLDDLKGVPSGEAAVAMIQPAPGKASVAVLLDVTAHLEQATAMQKKARANLIEAGAKESQQTIGEATVWIYDLPARAQDQVAAPKDGGAVAAVVTRQTIYFLAGTWFGATDNLEIAKGILGRMGGKASGDSLAEVAGFQMVMKRCAADAGNAVPQIRWFIYPLGYAEAARAATPADKRRKGKTVVEVIRNQGFTAIQGVGGFADFAPDGFELLHRTAIYAPPPWQKSMKMFAFINSVDFAPQPWVSREIATYASFTIDVLKAFDNFGPLFDELVGEGQEGVWIDTLQSLKVDPNGPQIDLREELIKNLGTRVTMVTDYKLPITVDSERLLFAVEAKNEQAVAKAIEKSVKTDPSVRKRTIEGHVIWEIIQEEQPKVPGIQLDVPSLTPKQPSLTDSKQPKEEEESGEEKGHLLPHGAITVANGQLLVASHIDFLVKMLKPQQPSGMLRNNLEFQQTFGMVDKLGLKTQCARQFSFTDEEFRPTYELIRQGKMPESETLLARTLNTLSGASKKGTARKQQIHGENLPDYQVVRRSLGPASLGVNSEENGWFIKGFLLKR